jgi:hypothetical protein
MKSFNEISKSEDSQPGTYQDSWRAGKGTFLSRLAVARLKNASPLKKSSLAMGKKSRNPAKTNRNPSSFTTIPDDRATGAAAAAPADVTAPSEANPTVSAPSTHSLAETAAGYPSDGPSHREQDEPLQTSSRSLQARLNQLLHCIENNDQAGFVANFVPLDVSAADAQTYLHTLVTEPQEWTNVAAELRVIATGIGVTRLDETVTNRVVYYFGHPLYPNCDREVAFCCCPQSGEWRAEG